MLEELKRMAAKVNESYHYEGPPMGNRPDNGEVYELATAFIGGKGYWHCGPCGRWHEDDPARDRRMQEASDATSE